MARRPTVGSSAVAGAERLDVIYVMGAGRSGSTILGVTLGNCEGVLFAGELDKWLARSGVPRLEDSARVSFWEAVRGEVQGAEDLFGHEAQRCLERSSAVFRVRDWFRRRRLREPYRRISGDLYRASARVAGVTRVVDTSHYPLRAMELKSLAGIDLHLVFLVRDPQSVVASFSRRDVVERSFGVLATNGYLWLTHVLSLRAFLGHPRERRLFVRYERFVANPEAVLRELLDMSGSQASLPRLAELNTGVAFHGNRLLRSQVTALEGQADARAPRSRLTTVLQLPWTVVFSRLRPAAGSKGSS
jgi:hypothetical protein